MQSAHLTNAFSEAGPIEEHGLPWRVRNSLMPPAASSMTPRLRRKICGDRGRLRAERSSFFLGVSATSLALASTFAVGRLRKLVESNSNNIRARSIGRFKAGHFNHLQLAFLAVAQTKALCLRRRRQAGAELRSAGDLRRHPPPRRAGGDDVIAVPALHCSSATQSMHSNHR
jgi:hypothetical protein